MNDSYRTFYNIVFFLSQKLLNLNPKSGKNLLRFYLFNPINGFLKDEKVGTDKNMFK